MSSTNLAGRGKQLFSLPGKLALLACRPSRELVDFLVFSNAREGEINLRTGDQREVSKVCDLNAFVAVLFFATFAFFAGCPSGSSNSELGLGT